MKKFSLIFILFFIVLFFDSSGEAATPIVASPIPNQTAIVGDNLKINVLGVFKDPDNEHYLTLDAVSSNPSVATAIVDYSDIKITPIASGTTTITLKADDGFGGIATTSFDVTVKNKPVVSTPILDQMKTIGTGDFTIDASTVFTHPDGDSITFTASSSDTFVATARVEGTNVIVTPKAGGIANITVRASDGKGGVAETTFSFLSNTAPTVEYTFSPRLHTIGTGAVLVDATNTFADADGNPLTITATSSDLSIATIGSISGKLISINPISRGTVTITITADDGKTGTASTTLTLILNERPVVASPIPNQVQTLGFGSHTYDATNTFSDADGDNITLTATSSNNGVATVSVSGKNIILTPITAGTATITITAKDGRGGEITHSFPFLSNTAPIVANAIDSQTLIVGSGDLSVDVTNTFSDADGDLLTLTAISSNPGIATANVTGTILTVTPVSAGSITITVTANDGKDGMNGTAVATVNVEVKPIPVFKVRFELEDYPAIVAQDVKKGSLAVIPQPIPLRAGYTFDNWYQEATWLNVFDFTNPINQDTTVYGKWEANQYAVTYDGNGSTGGTPPNAMSYEYNANVIVAGQGSLVKSGYIFAGWNTAADGNGINYTANDMFVMGSAPITLYAKWIEKQAPIVSDYQKTTTKNTQVNGTVVATDADGDPLTYTKGSGPTNGTVQVNVDGTWVYIPTIDYVGVDSFTVIVSNGYGRSATSTITITIQKPPSTEATVQTGQIVGISDTKATFSGTVVSDGDSPVTERGFVYSTDMNVTTADTIVISGSGIGAFTAKVVGLNPNTTYYVRAYAENENGIAYGSVVSFLTTGTPQPVFNQKPVATDVDVIGTKTAGSTLTGSYAYQDMDGDVEAESTFKWYQAGDQNGSNAVSITGATNTTYKLVSNDIGKYIAFEVTPVATTGDTIGISVKSPYYGPIQSSANGSSTSGDSSSASLLSSNSYFIQALMGGIIEYEGAKIVIPANAFRNNFTVVITNVTNTTNLPIQENSQLISDVYEITKDQVGNFDKVVTITLPFDKSKYDKTNFTVSIFWFNEATKEWVELENVKTDEKSGKVSGEVNHFTKFAILATKKADLPTEEQKEATQPPTVSFIDIKGHWAEKEIVDLVSKGVIKGFPDGSFKPNSNISRAEFASIAVRALDLTCEQGKAFVDTTDHWAKDCISTAVANGIVAGMDADKFAPNAPITREQMAAIIARAAKLDAQEAGTAFKDDAQISAWAKSFVDAAAKHQLVGGFPDGSFNPKGKATRAEAVVMITRLIK
ncbi:MAG TPA: cadherin-like domain-containing protein [Bacillus bacterium]|nr:cadherin-like domain-containing protein [Bacillus sp. (in: firmicutes)]